MTAQPVKSRIPDIIKNDIHFGTLLAYPFQQVLFHGLATPLERLQVIRQCSPNIILHQNGVIVSQVQADPKILAAYKNHTLPYSVIIKGDLTRH